MSSNAQKRAAEERARQVLLMCDQIDSCRRRLDESGPIEFSSENVLRQEEQSEQRQTSSAAADRKASPSAISVSSDDTRSIGTVSTLSPADAMSADDYRKVLRNMQEHSALKSNRLNTEITSLQLELANARFELEQATLALRNAERDKNELRASLNGLVAGSEMATLSLGEENAVLAKKMQELRAERDALLLENTMLKNSSHHGATMMSSTSQHSTTSTPSRSLIGGGLSARLQRVKRATAGGSAKSNSSDGSVVSEETESVTSDATLEDCDGNTGSQGSVAEVTTTSGSSLGFRASTLRS